MRFSKFLEQKLQLFRPNFWKCFNFSNTPKWLTWETLLIVNICDAKNNQIFLRSGYLESDRLAQESQLDFVAGIEDEGITIESELDEDSEWHQVQFTERNDGELQSFTRGLTPSQIKTNRGHMPE